MVTVPCAASGLIVFHLGTPLKPKSNFTCIRSEKWIKKKGFKKKKIPGKIKMRTAKHTSTDVTSPRDPNPVPMARVFIVN